MAQLMRSGTLSRRELLRAAAAAVPASAASRPDLPNVIMIYADDLGYGDVGAYGSPIRTPNIDRMAREGMMLRQFCSASPVCSPSRAALLTGRYPVRVGVPRVLGPLDTTGLGDSEVTMAQMLRSNGYKTACIGKWHLGTAPAHLPTARGFEEYFGIPYSNDMFPSVLMRNTGIVETPVDQATITHRYTEEAVAFIRQCKHSPFFLYLPHTMPHIPLAASPRFAGKSPLGPYGDAIEELDWSVGQILRELDALNIDDNTLVMFSSDNGPWYQGSPGRLRGRKGETFEGGVRVPFIARMPGRIPAGKVVRSFASTLDILPTVSHLTGAKLPTNPIDGVNIWPMLTGAVPEVEHPPFLYFDDWNLQCVRTGKWKAHLNRYNGAAYSPAPPAGRLNYRLTQPELYDLDMDPTESFDVARDHPGVITGIRGKLEPILATFPNEVQRAWTETQARPVNGTWPGSWPTPLQ